MLNECSKNVPINIPQIDRLENSYQDFRSVENGSSKGILQNKMTQNILLIKKVKHEKHSKVRLFLYSQQKFHFKCHTKKNNTWKLKSWPLNHDNIFGGQTKSKKKLNVKGKYFDDNKVNRAKKN